VEHGIIAPLTRGATVLADAGEFEANRWYANLAQHHVTVWYTAPTALRMLIRNGTDLPAQYDLTALRLVTSVGEPLNPEIVVWGQQALGRPVHDNWWQTETGAIMISNYECRRPARIDGTARTGVEVGLLKRGDDGRAEIRNGGVIEVDDWSSSRPLGRLDLATVPNHLPEKDLEFARSSVRSAAGRYLTTIRDQAYGVPLTENEYTWGSNSVILNKLVVIGSAFDLTGEQQYRDGVLEGLDYILGRNALNQSYVTGYRTRFTHNQRSSIFAHQLDPTLPQPPPGSIAGGPNPGLEDPKAKKTLLGTTTAGERPKPQFCYLDDIESWSTDEVAINTVHVAAQPG